MEIESADTGEDLSRSLQLKRAFDAWFDFHLKPIIEDSRNRVEMVLPDAADRIERGLSALPSTKSLSIVDGYVENAILEYNQDPDSISFTSRTPNNPQRDKFAQILTEDFIYRKDNTSNFHLWQEASLRSGATDGLECAFVHWVYESFQKEMPDKFVSPGGKEVPQSIYELYGEDFGIQRVPQTQEIVARDTWVIDRLMPRRDCFWDPKIPYMDVNLGEFAGVMIPITLSQVMGYKARGVFDLEFTEEDIEGLLANTREGNDAALTSGFDFSQNERVDLKDKNRAELMIFFEKIDFQWFVTFSISGRFQLSTQKPVNDVFFNGRPVNRLPLVVGYLKSRLWDATGVGFPEIIAPIEDELSDHRNNANDIAKQMAQGGRIRVNPDHNVDLDQVANARMFLAEKDEVEFIQYQPGMLESMRMDDSRSQDIAALVPMGIADRSRQLALKGSTKGLGLHQMQEQDANAKLGVSLMIRNRSFFIPVLSLIAQLTMAYETDEVVLKIAARNANTQLPTTIRGGRKIIDVSVFDFEVDVQVNAGLGAVPRYKKAQNLLQIMQIRQQAGIPTDFQAAAGMLNVLAGFNEDQFNAPSPPPQPPPVDYKATIAVDLTTLLQLSPQAGQFLLNKMIAGEMAVTANVAEKTDKPVPYSSAALAQNGGGMAMPERAGAEVPDMMGPAAAAMSEGGMQ